MKVVTVKSYTRKIGVKHDKAKQEKTTALWDFVFLREVMKALDQEFKRKG